MTKSTFPDEWLQPLVTEKLLELNSHAMKDFVTVEKKAFDVLQKNNLDLMEKLEIAKTALEVIATHTVFADAPEDRVQQLQTVCDIAEDALKEIKE